MERGIVMPVKRILLYSYEKINSNVLFFLNKISEYVDKIIFINSKPIDGICTEVHSSIESAIQDNSSYDEYIIANDLFYGPFSNIKEVFTKMSSYTVWSIDPRFYNYKSFVVFSRNSINSNDDKVNYLSSNIIDIDTNIIDLNIPFLHKSYFYKEEYSFFSEKLRRIYDYLKNSSDYDFDIIIEDIINSRNCKNVNSIFSMNYVLSSEYAEKSQYLSKKIALIVYIYAEELIGYISYYLKNIPESIDIYIVTTKEDIIKKFGTVLCDISNYIEYRIQVNRGRDNVALLVTCRDLFEKYDYIGFVHSKQSKQNKITAKEFRNHCFNSLLYNRQYVNNLLNKFEENKYLGLLIPYPPEFEPYSTIGNEWLNNYENAQNIVRLRLGKNINLEKNDVICAFGNMFWVKTQACKSILEMNFKIDDFPIEPLDKCDGLLTHSIERIMPSLVQRDGFFTSYVIPDIEASMYINTLMDSIKKLKRSM